MRLQTKTCSAIDHALAAARTNRFYPRRLGPQPSDRSTPHWTEKGDFFPALRDRTERPRRRSRPPGRRRRRRGDKTGKGQALFGDHATMGQALFGVHAHTRGRTRKRSRKDTRTHAHTHTRTIVRTTDSMSSCLRVRPTSRRPRIGHLLVVARRPASCPWWLKLVWH